MHELSIAESILEVIDRHCAEAGAQRCSSVTVRAGLLTAVDEEALRFAFETLAERSSHAGAELVVERTWPLAECSCGATFQVTDLLYTCPACGATSAKLSGGDELDVIKLEVEKE